MNFRNIISKELNCHISLKLIEDLDEAIENFTKAIQATWKSIREIKT